MSEIIIIAAVAKNGIIGRDGKIPWYIKEDFQHFKELTSGYPIIMGRKTWESLPMRPLKDRLNIILTRQEDFKVKGGFVKNSLKDALEYCKNHEKIFLIGGESVYRMGLRFATRIELTRINKDYKGNAYFPEINWDEWKVVKKIDRNDYSFLSYVKK